MRIASSWTLPRLAGFVRPYRHRFFLGLGANAAARACDLIPMVLVGRAVDAITAAKDGAAPELNLLLAYGAAVMASFVLLAVFQSYSDFVLDAMAQHVRHDLRMALYGHLQRQDMHFFEERQSGDLLNVVSSDVDTLESFLSDASTSTIRLIITFAGTFAVLFWMDWRLACMLLAPMPFAFAAVRTFSTRIRPRYREARAAVGRVAGIIGNNLRGMGVIQAFTAEAEQARRVEGQSARYRDEAVGAALARARFIPVLYAVAGAAFALLIAGGGWLTLSPGGPSVGDYATFILLATRLILPLFVFGMLINQFQRSEAAAKRIWDILSLTPAILDAPDAHELDHSPGVLEFRDVRFAYPDRDAVLRGVNLRLERGRMLGVVGPTGAGKSTLVKLALRHLDPAGGHVLLDGQDMAGLTLASLRRRIGYVSQDAFLFTGSVEENIRLGAADAPFAAVEQAAQLAGALSFIRELPQGFHTAIGEGGVKLSGGQRQRISLARAVLRAPDILVLDEATSAVDTRTEEIIQRNLEALRPGRMILAVAHRLSTVRHADQIVVLVDGVIVERGSHEELLTLKGVYAGLWAVQSGELTAA